MINNWEERMNKKICSILMAALLIFSVPLFSCSAETLSTTVKYESRGSAYYEINVPLEMVPGETAIVSAVGNWGSQEVLNVTADTVVTLLSDEHPDDMIDLTIEFDGIHKYGSDDNETNVSQEISVENIFGAGNGLWEGTFDYYVEMTVNDDFEEHSGVIPEGGTYYVSATEKDGVYQKGDYSGAQVIYESGDNFPEEVKPGDVYVYGDYEYRYQCAYEDIWFTDYTKYNWGVSVVDTEKSSYEKMLTSINGKVVDNLIGAYDDCVNMEISPPLPHTAKNMKFAYIYCYSLKEAPVIPDGVTTMISTFDNCSSLEVAPTIPLSVTDIGGCFIGCSSLRVPPVIHENILYAYDAFSACYALSGTLEVNATNLIEYADMLMDTNITEITGSISDELKSEILATK